MWIHLPIAPDSWVGLKSMHREALDLSGSLGSASALAVCYWAGCWPLWSFGIFICAMSRKSCCENWTRIWTWDFHTSKCHICAFVASLWPLFQSNHNMLRVPSEKCTRLDTEVPWAIHDLFLTLFLHGSNISSNICPINFIELLWGSNQITVGEPFGKALSCTNVGCLMKSLLF